MKSYTKLTFKIFLEHALHYKGRLGVILVATALATLVGLVPPLLYKRFFDLLSSDLKRLSSTSELVHIIVLILFVHLAITLFWRIAFFTNNRFQPMVTRDLAHTCFVYLHKHSFNFFNNNFVGSLVKRINRFYSAFETLLDRALFDLLKLAIEVSAITIILFTKSPILGASLFIWIVLFVILNYYYSVFKLKYDVQRSEQDTKVTGVLADTITNQSNIKLLVGHAREQGRFLSAMNELRRLRTLTWDLGQLAETVQVTLMIALEFFIFYFAIKIWNSGGLTVGDFVLIQAYILTIFHHIWDFGRIIRDFYEKIAEAEEMTVILDTPHEIKDKKRAEVLKVPKGKIEFIDVNFNYNKTRRVINKLNLSIKPGERIALVGPSGAGKTTVVKLLLRIHDVTSGRVCIDGKKISDVTQDSLHENISLVPQDPILFHRTLLENIRYGKPDATDKEVMEASKLSHCHDFISLFPYGYDTYVGERGVKLSGGERQRVAIARAILRNAPILVLDEATSSLDSESEMFIQDALDGLMKNKTVIIIAHRLSTIMKMDRILVIDGGTVVEAGSHHQLIKNKSGLYHRLWKVQAGGFMS